MTDDARQVLARLATAGRKAHTAKEDDETAPDQTYRDVIERATAAVDDLEAAAAFVEEDGIPELEAAVERADHAVSGCAGEGKRALNAFREFRAVATGDQFQSGRGSALGGADIAPSE